MNNVKLALVGYGGIAAFHAKAFQKIPEVTLKTVVGRRAVPAAEFQSQMGFANSTTDFKEALGDPEINAVVIASPSELHYEMTKDSLEAGKDVLVEIPLALSHKGAVELAGLVKKTGRKVLVAHTRRFDPLGQFVRDYIGSGKAGKVYIHHAYEFQMRHENVGWTGYRRSWTDDVLFHHGCHVLDFALWTIDVPVRRIRGELTPIHEQTGTSLDVGMLLRFTNEALASLSLSYNSPKGGNGSVYLCESGTLSIEGRSVKLNGEALFESDTDLSDHILNQNREFIDAIRSDRSPVCGVDEALQSMVLLQQVYDQMVTLEGEEKYRRMWGP